MPGTERSGRRIFQRLLIFNIVAVLVVSVLPQFVFYRYFMSIYNEEIQGLNMQTVRQFQTAIEEPVVKATLDFPNRYLSELESNEALVYPLTHDISRNSAAILRVARRIDDIKNNAAYIHSIDLYYRYGNLMFMGDRVCMMDTTAGCELGGRADWFRSFQSSDINIAWVSARPAGYYDPSPIASYVRSIPFFGTSELRQGIVAVNIDLQELNRRLTALKPNSEGGLVIIDEQGGILAHNYGDLPLPEFKTEPLAGRFGEDPVGGQFEARIADRASVVSYVPSQYNSWRYVSIASVESVNRKATQLRNWLIGIGAMFLAVNGLISVWLTMRAHKPISSRMETLQHSLQRHMPIVRHNYILGLLFGTLQDRGQRGELGTVLGLRHDGRWTAAFVLRVRRDEKLEAQDAMAADFHLIEQLERAEPGVQIRAIRDERSQLLGLVSLPMKLNEREVARIIQSTLGESGETYLLCIGNVVASSDEAIARSFAEADEAAEYAFLYPSEAVLTYSALQPYALHEPAGSPRSLDELPPLLRAGDGKQAREQLLRLLDHVREGGWTIRYCRNLLLDLALTIDKTAQQLGLQPSELFGGELREQYREIADIAAYEAWILAAADAVVAALAERKQQFDHEFSERIVTFVNQNITHQLSLAYVADHVGVSPTYLSKIFKGLTGSNFNEYVTALRLEKAAQLLRERKLSVQEISLRVGYQSTHHFIRLFKEKHGMTPKQYQKAMADEDDSGADA